MRSVATFAVNGRFLTQRVTGVQRYARAVVEALDTHLTAGNESAPILAPHGATDPGLRSMPLRVLSPLRGHAWEQITLPARNDLRLLNLCNTAPASRRDQVVCIHDANTFNMPNAYGRSFRMAYGALHPLLVRQALRIATVSSFSAREISRHLPIDSQSIAVLPNGHEHALDWDPTQADRAMQARLAERHPDGRPFVLALGSRSRHKNLDLLLRIAPRLDEMGIDLVVAGGSDAVFARNDAGTTRPRNVMAIGYVTDADLAWIMDRALCLAFPSWTEGFGLPIVEAMARGCPVVSSDRASMPEVCGTAALMAPPDEPDAWLRQIATLLGSSTLRGEMTERGREQARRFRWRDTAAGYHDLLTASGAVRHPRPASPSASDCPRIAVVIATRGRPRVVEATVRHLLATQSLPPVATIVSCVDPADAGDLVDRPEVRIVTGSPGLTAQRNAGLAALACDTEIVVFFDDDFVAHQDWLLMAATAFGERPEVAGLTGRVLVDDIKGPGLSFAEAEALTARPAPPAEWSTVEGYSPYGCNMAFRRSAIGTLRFDERLPLYGWLEDRDFGAALAERGGRLVKIASAVGVHMGVKGGRVSGRRLGYSQVINPVYLYRKGTMSAGQVLSHMFRNIVSNVLRSPKPEPFIDRRGRLEGNARGLADILRGHIEPERVLLVPRDKG